MDRVIAPLTSASWAAEGTLSGQPVADAGIPGERANQATHAAGFALSLCAAAALLPAVAATQQGDRLFAAVLYLASLIGVYGASTLSHSFPDDQIQRDKFRMVDQIAIYLKIVCTFTAWTMVSAVDPLGLTLLTLMWVGACYGIVARINSDGRSLPAAGYLALGLIPLLEIQRIVAVTETLEFTCLVGGGLAYIGGVWFLVNDHRHRYFHAVWHLSTITGSTLHFVFMYGTLAA